MIEDLLQINNLYYGSETYNVHHNIIECVFENIIDDTYDLERYRKNSLSNITERIVRIVTAGNVYEEEYQ
jgi:hemerythrin superfamily protein